MTMVAAAWLSVFLLPAAAAAPQQQAQTTSSTAERPPAPAKAPPPSPGQWLLDTFGAQGMAALQERGYVVLQGKPEAYRLQVVHWKSLEGIARNAKAVAQFSESLANIKLDRDMALPGPLPFLALGELPPEGLMTAELHALLDAMSAFHDECQALASAPNHASAAPAPPASPEPNLFDTPWGKAFANQTHANLMADPQPAVKPYFDTYLSGLHPVPGASAHFTAYAREHYQVDVSSRLAADQRLGEPSDALRADLRRYLGDQSRWHALARIRRQVDEMGKRPTIARDLQRLEAVAAVFRARSELLTELEGAIQTAAPPAPVPELASAGLHLEKPLHLGRHELGDTAVVSGGYWIDGLSAGASIDIDETTFREFPGGLRDAQTRTVRRGNGGPYAFSRRMELAGSDSFTFRSVISAPFGNAVMESLAVPVAQELELALLKLAAADNQNLTCDFKGASAAYARFAESLAGSAGEKPQYRELLETARLRQAQTEGDAGRLAAVEKAMAAARAESAPEACRYDPQATDAAMAMARALPAGCDRRISELRRLRELIARRAADQKAFAANYSQAALHRAACRFALAAEDLSRGLAILDADPAARCGKTAAGARRSELDLLAVRSDELWRARFAEQLRLAPTEPIAAERLELLRPVIARIGTLNRPACFTPEREKAEKLAKAAGAAMVLPDAVAAKLGADSGLADVMADVAAQRRKLATETAALRSKEAKQEAPTHKPAGAAEDGP